MIRSRTGDKKGKPGVRPEKRDKKAGYSPSSPVLPGYISDLISSYIVHKTGKNLDDPVMLDRIRQSVMAQKAAYWKGKDKRRVRYEKGYSIFAYLAYHAPVYIVQFISFIRRLDNAGLVPDDIVLLDVGSGPGVVPLAFVEYFRERCRGTLKIHAIERSEEHLEAYRYLLPKISESISSVTLTKPVMADLTIIPSSDLPARYNVLTFQNVLAELTDLPLEKRVEILMRYTDHLDPDGLLILIEPADLEHSVDLRRIQNELLKKGLYVADPCSYPWGSRCHPDECWSFFQGRSIAPTDLMRLLSGTDEAYRFTNTDIKYSYTVLTKRPVSIHPYLIPRGTRYVRLSHINRFPGRMISVTVSKMSGDLGDIRAHIFKVCDGTCQAPVYIVIPKRKRGPANQALFDGSYGDILVIEGVLVRKHHTYNSWNLLTTPSTRIYPPGKEELNDEDYEDLD